MTTLTPIAKTTEQYGSHGPLTHQRMERVLATPEWIEKTLGKQENFRPVRPPRITRMMSSIEAEGWRADGNTVKFDSAGNLIDGQHRLTALWRLGISVWLWVCYGVDDDSTIDSGIPRSIGHYLRHGGESNYNSLASALGHLWRYNKFGHIGGGPNQPSVNEILTTLEIYPHSRESVSIALGCRDIMAVGLMGFLHTVASTGSVEKATEFVDQLENFETLREDSPVLQLRVRMRKDQDSRAKLSLHEKSKLMIRAWNLFIENKPCRLLRLTDKTATPKIIIPKPEV